MSLRRWADRDVSRDRSSFAFRIFNVSKEGAMGEQVLITGASAGLGVEFAHLYAEQGCDLILTARREDRMHALADELRAKHGIRVRVFAADLADPSAPRALYDWVASEDVAVNILVNNAGFGLRGRFADLPLDRQLAMLRVNVNALTELTGLFLPGCGRAGVVEFSMSVRRRAFSRDHCWRYTMRPKRSYCRSPRRCTTNCAGPAYASPVSPPGRREPNSRKRLT
jgi:NAD(P)-dependent dehydrogenase (short-subunit alcohol dehydrogenase family)